VSRRRTGKPSRAEVGAELTAFTAAHEVGLTRTLSAYHKRFVRPLYIALAIVAALAILALVR